MDALQKATVRFAKFLNMDTANPVPFLHHVQEEIQELIEEPRDKYEYADALILLLTAAHAAGLTGKDLIIAAWEKMDRNWQREWEEPDDNGVRRHVKKVMIEVPEKSITENNMEVIKKEILEPFNRIGDQRKDDTSISPQR